MKSTKKQFLSLKTLFKEIENEDWFDTSSEEACETTAKMIDKKYGNIDYENIFLSSGGLAGIENEVNMDASEVIRILNTKEVNYPSKDEIKNKYKLLGEMVKKRTSTDKKFAPVVPIRIFGGSFDKKVASLKGREIVKHFDLLSNPRILAIWDQKLNIDESIVTFIKEGKASKSKNISSSVEKIFIHKERRKGYVPGNMTNKVKNKTFPVETTEDKK